MLPKPSKLSGPYSGELFTVPSVENQNGVFIRIYSRSSGVSLSVLTAKMLLFSRLCLLLAAEVSIGVLS